MPEFIIAPWSSGVELPDIVGDLGHAQRNKPLSGGFSGSRLPAAGLIVGRKHGGEIRGKAGGISILKGFEQCLGQAVIRAGQAQADIDSPFEVPAALPGGEEFCKGHFQPRRLR